MPRLREVPHADIPELFEDVCRDGWGARSARTVLIGDDGRFAVPGLEGGFNPSGMSGNLFTVWANHPALFKDFFLGTNIELVRNGLLPHALREIAILRTAFVLGCRTVYALHQNEAYWFDGIPREKADEVATWVNSSLFDPQERAILAYVDELVLGHGRVQDATFDRLKELLSDAQILELSYVIGEYTIHSYICKALRLEWDDVSERVVSVPRPADSLPDDEVIAHFNKIRGK